MRMIDIQEIIKKAEEFALSEIEKYGTPAKFLFHISNEKGVELARKLNANSDIVQIGTRLMDIKLGEALSKGKLKEHIEMGVEASKNFLSQFELPEEILDKIINCVEGHHGTVDWKCKEAEICANADCYRFLLTKYWVQYISFISSREGTFDDHLAQAEAKADEKWKILSIDMCKKELEPHYKLIKEIIKKARSK
jgi:hypothetical protein